MGMKQDIVLKNEYSVPTPSGGSSGGTPGQYALRYMARKLASEPVAPIKGQRLDAYMTRYMAREDAVETMEVLEGPDAPRRLKRQMKRSIKSGGVSFGYGSTSLSHEELVAASDDIQEQFDSGSTAMKLVMSFSHDYMKRTGIVDEDFELKARGDYRGNIDQMKLRMGIMRGIERMERSYYDELRYVGVIQVDTNHVHAHLVMVDAGRGTVMPDGTQRGKIDAPAQSMLRRGLDAYLDEHQKVAHMSSAVGYERRNVTTYVKKWAHNQMLSETLPQFLLSTLPEDRRMWRADTNRREMSKPNRIVREIVEEVVDRDDSPMSQAMSEVHEYATHRMLNEDLSADAHQRLIDTGKQRIIDQGVNAVYASLRQMPADALRVRTPMLDVMGMDYEEIARRNGRGEDEDDLIGFGFRLRSYATRRRDHDQKRQQNRASAQRWEHSHQIGAAREPSRVMHEFYLEEEAYHAKAAAKYRHFLRFTALQRSWKQDWDRIAVQGERLISLESMINDASLKRTKDLDVAESIGWEVYGQPGGSQIASGDAEDRAQVVDRAARMRHSYQQRIDDLRAELAEDSLVLTVTRDTDGTRDVAEVSEGVEYDFEDVKGVDLHDMRYDFSRDVEVGSAAREAFIEQARRRQQRLDAAMSYLHQSDQAVQIEGLPVSDITRMTAMANEVSTGGDQAVLPSAVAQLARRQLARRSATVELTQRVSTEIEDTLSAVRFSEPEPEVDDSSQRTPAG